MIFPSQCIGAQQLHNVFRVSRVWSMWPVSQIPQCTSSISHSVPFCNRNVRACTHFCYKMVYRRIIVKMHCGICEMAHPTHVSKWATGAVMMPNLSSHLALVVIPRGAMTLTLSSLMAPKVCITTTSIRCLHWPQSWYLDNTWFSLRSNLCVHSTAHGFKDTVIYVLTHVKRMPS